MAKKNEETDPKAQTPEEGAASEAAPADTGETAQADIAEQPAALVTRHPDGKLTIEGLTGIALEAVNEAHFALGTQAVVAFEDVKERVSKRLWDPNGEPASPHIEDVLIGAIVAALASRTKR